MQTLKLDTITFSDAFGFSPNNLWVDGCCQNGTPDQFLDMAIISPPMSFTTETRYSFVEVNAKIAHRNLWAIRKEKYGYSYRFTNIMVIGDRLFHDSPCSIPLSDSFPVDERDLIHALETSSNAATELSILRFAKAHRMCLPIKPLFHHKVANLSDFIIPMFEENLVPFGSDKVKIRAIACHINRRDREALIKRFWPIHHIDRLLRCIDYPKGKLEWLELFHTLGPMLWTEKRCLRILRNQLWYPPTQLNAIRVMLIHGVCFSFQDLSSLFREESDRMKLSLLLSGQHSTTSFSSNTHRIRNSTSGSQGPSGMPKHREMGERLFSTITEDGGKRLINLVCKTENWTTLVTNRPSTDHRREGPGSCTLIPPISISRSYKNTHIIVDDIRFETSTGDQVIVQSDGVFASSGSLVITVLPSLINVPRIDKTE